MNNSLTAPQLADKAKQEGVSQQTIDDVFPRLVHKIV